MLLMSFLVFAQVENKEAQLITGWDVGLSGGAVFYSSVFGYNGILETRIYLAETAINMNLFVGAGGSYQCTKFSDHTITQVFGYGLTGFDYFFLKNIAPSMKYLSLRTQFAGGGGYTFDQMGEMDNVTKDSKCGYLIRPSAGLDYLFGKAHLSVMCGYEVIGVGPTTATALTTSLGVSYSIF